MMMRSSASRCPRRRLPAFASIVIASSAFVLTLPSATPLRFISSDLPLRPTIEHSPSRSTRTTLLGGDDGDSVPSPPLQPSDIIENCKRELIRRCVDRGGGGGRSATVEDSIRELERLGEDLGIGQVSSMSGLINGVWELVYSPDDITRSSPFFWAFRRAFPDSSDQIFGITDAIPEPFKVVGPATQTIDVDLSSGTGTSIVTGTLVSRVKVATLGGMATSIMTTRCAILGADGLDALRMRVTSTKPEESTILSKLGPLGELLSSSSPPFPSGNALDRVAPGSSEVVMRTTYCDEGLRVSRNADRPGRTSSFGSE